MTALDMTADAEEYREIASQWHGGQASALYAYASSGAVVPGLSQEVRRCLQDLSAITSTPRRKVTPADFSDAFRLGKLLGHVSGLEDRLNEDRACEKSPTGWHEWANNEQCCHCGKEVP